MSFESELKKSSSKNELELKTTHPGHIGFQDISSKSSSSTMKTYEVEGLEEQNDGNNVNLDHQMSEMSKNSIMFDAFTAVY